MRKRDKLYKVNKWNQPLFAQGVDREHQNIFDEGGSVWNYENPIVAQSLVAKPTYDFNYLNNVSPSSLGKDTNAFGSYFAGNPDKSSLSNTTIKGFSSDSNNGDSEWASIASAGKAAAMSLADNIQIGNSKRGLWDAADPIYHLAGGRESAVGNGLSDAGVGVFKFGAQSGNLPLMAVGAGVKVLGGLTNAAFGIKTDKERLNAINAGVDKLKNFKSDASSFDDVQGPDAIVDNTKNVYEGGWFSGGKAKKKNTVLSNKVMAAETHAYNSVDNNINNITGMQRNNLLANYAAFGGQLDGQGAIDYGFMSDYLTTKKKVAETKDKINSGNVFGALQATPFSAFALGGDMQTNGGDYSTGLTHIDAGGSHEESPYEGVQMGISSENGQPNLVEEGETVFDDYVFSRRIKPDSQTKKKFHVGKNSDITFADLSKRLEKESLERPNDPLSQAALKKQMHALAEEQERQKNEQQAKEMQDAFARLSPEQQQAIMQQMAMEEQQAVQAQQEQQAQQLNAEQQQQLAQQQPDAQQVVDEQMQMQQPRMEEAQMAACGGKLNKFDKGGEIKKAVYKALGLYTDSDFDKWANDHKLSKIDDWENVTKNRQFIDTLSASNPALADAMSKGYDFGTYRANNASPYNLATFNDVLDNYTMSKNQGNLDGNYAIDDTFNLGNFKNIGELENSANYKAYTKYLTDLASRAKGIKFSGLTPDGKWKDYKDIEWGDNKNKLTEADYNALQTLWHHTQGTSTKSEGKPVPLFSTDENGQISLADNAGDLITRYRTDGKGGIFHLTPEAIQRKKEAINYEVADDGTIHEIIGDVPKGWANVGAYNWQNKDTDYGYNYYKRPGAKEGTKPVEEDKYEPVHKATWGRYAGLFGPVVGLGMQMAGIGKPDYSQLDASIEAASGAPALAHYKPIGNYLTYRPMDIWYEQNRMNANSRATDRAILNNASPLGTKMAGLLANGYNSQIGSGNLYKQALEYNDAQRQKVAEFNRGTDMFNAQAFNQTSATNAQLQNSHKNFKAQLLMDAARQRMAADAAWNQGIYGNVNALFKGLGDWGKENAQHNMIADMAADGLFGTMSDKQYIAKDSLRKVKTKAKGGKLNRKKGLTI